ncbi:uncharacterized membrane protein C3orf80 homolog [Nerophis ophidion]|uniref:uncharacterized membrane protein C3orf80 homolog n=1 Tax=Nerophis ophidion TaxID=159077 RepID=UPI002ADF945F|nr:uncharacterized membrane protein C3orf80 homolog [Nerophis ophidion]
MTQANHSGGLSHCRPARVCRDAGRRWTETRQLLFLRGGGRHTCSVMMPRVCGGRCLVSACLLSACDALRSCGEVQCGSGQQCCPPPVTGNGSSSSVAAVRCCKLPIHVFFDNVGWFTRKLSGILILLLLFAMGYFIQRVVCPRPRRHRQQHQDRGEEPDSLFGGRTSASQDSLLERRYPGCTPVDVDVASPSLPAYDEVKYLPTYEESMREMHRDRSDDNLLAEHEGGSAGRGRAEPPGVGDQRPDVVERTSRN